MFGVNLVIQAEIREELLRTKVKFPGILGQNGQTFLDSLKFKVNDPHF